MDQLSLRGNATARVLVVASQCLTMPRLEKLTEAAVGLHDALRDPDLGACEPGLPDGQSLILGTDEEPLTDRVIAGRIKDAYRHASETQATLVLALLGHGFSPPGGSGLYFMAGNSELDDRDTAVDVTSLLLNAADRHGVDGVLALLDMCSAGAAPPSTSVLTGGFRQGSTRLAVLMATAAGQDAYDMKFASALTGLLVRGVPNAGEYLTPAALTSPLASALRGRQDVQRFEWDGNAWTGRDVGMWLARNRAVSDIWSDTLDAEWARQLTTAYHDTPARRRLLDALANHKMVALVAPPGHGKSVLMAGLTQPVIAGADTAHAVVFADRHYSLVDIARIISNQLAVRLSGHIRTSFLDAREKARSANPQAMEASSVGAWPATYDDWAETMADAWEVELVRPLAKLPASASITICVDGTDQLHPTVFRHLVQRFRSLLAISKTEVRVVLAGQPEVGLTASDHAARIGANLISTVSLDHATIRGWLDDRGTPNEVGAAVLARYDGSWLLAGLLLRLADDGVSPDHLPQDLDSAYDLIHRRASLSLSVDCAVALKAILAANGPDPVPLEVVEFALAVSGQMLDTPSLRNVLTRLRPILIRLRPGTPHEILRLLHATYAHYLVSGLDEEVVRTAHGWLLDACDQLSDRNLSDHRIDSGVILDPVTSYIFTTRPEHLAAIGRLEDLAEAIVNMQDYRRLYAADRRDDWSYWLDRLSSERPDHPALILDLRQRHAHWTGLSGEATRARDLYQALIREQQLALGAGHPEVLATRSRLAYWTGRAGDPGPARDHLQQLVEEQKRVLGPDHVDTFATRRNLARWTGEVGRIGDRKSALRQFKSILEDQIRVLGVDHPDTFASRRSIAFWTAQTDDRPRTLRQLAKLLDDQVRVLGEDHPETFATRGDLAHWTSQIGDRAGARDQALNLLGDQVRILGPDHPAVFATRANLARWTGEAGDGVAARDQLKALLEHQRIVLGPGHPATFATRANLARWTGEAGDGVAARDQLAALLEDQREVLGPDHPNTFPIRAAIVRWTGRSGNLVAARDLGLALLKDMRRVVGPDDTRVRRMSRKITQWTRPSGADHLGALLQDQQRVLGPDHVDTIATRGRLAGYIGEAGNAAAARDEYGSLLQDQQRLLGLDHTDVFATRDNLAYWTGMAGNPAGARDQYIRLLEDVRRAAGSGAGDPTAEPSADEFASFAFTTRSRLAHWTGMANNPAAARDQYAKLVEDQQSRLGPDHPDVFTSRTSIVRWTARAGDRLAARAQGDALIADMRRVLGTDDTRTVRTEQRVLRWTTDSDLNHSDLTTLLEEQQGSLGSDHPMTLATRARLAEATGREGNPPGARDEYRALVRDLERVLGPEHVDTLSSMSRLADWTGRAGNARSARNQTLALIENMQRIYGAEDARTVRVRQELARWMADPAALKAQLETLAGDQSRQLGFDHPETLATRRRLAERIGESGDFETARDRLMEILGDQARVLSSDHPDTLATRACLAHWTGRAGDLASAREQFSVVTLDQGRVLGPDHPDTLNARHRLAHVTGEAGDAAAARDQYQTLLDDQRRILGPDHPDTFNSRANLVRWTWAAGDIESARELAGSLLDDMRRIFGPGDSRTTRMRRRLGRWTTEPGLSTGLDGR